MNNTKRLYYAICSYSLDSYVTLSSAAIFKLFAMYQVVLVVN